MASINDLATAAIASNTQDESGHRGAFIVLEGLDRSGKTTQVKLLEQRFVEEGKKVKVMRFPGKFDHHDTKATLTFTQIELHLSDK
jgi:dTMP kinase